MARIWIDIGSEEEEEELTDVHVGDPRDVVDRGVRARGVDALVGMDVASEHDVDSGVTQKRLPGLSDLGRLPLALVRDIAVVPRSVEVDDHPRGLLPVH